MKSLFRIAFAAILAVIVTGCSLERLADIEPSSRDRREFERQLSQSLTRAVRAPGIDNGSTIVVTTSGDTLIAPADSTLEAAQLRTVYVDIRPAYPRRISSKVMEMAAVLSGIGVVAAMVILILLGVFIVVIRRQHGRNKLIARAIAEGYQLPESFFTGIPASPAVTVVNEEAPCREASAAAPGATATQPDAAPQEPQCPPYPGPEFIRKVAGSATTSRVKDLSRSFIMLGLAVVIFLAFAAGHNAELGFFFGGILAVFGGAKLLTLYLSNKL